MLAMPEIALLITLFIISVWWLFCVTNTICSYKNDRNERFREHNVRKG